MPVDDACIVFEGEGFGDPFCSDPVVDWEDFKEFIEDWDWTDDFYCMTGFYRDYLNE